MKGIPPDKLEEYLLAYKNFLMKYLKFVFLYCVTTALLTGCSKEDEVYNSGNLSQVEHIIDYDPATNYKGKHEISIQQSNAIEFNNIEGLQNTDEFIVRYKPDNNDIFLNWGYKYTGIVGNEDGEYQREYETETVMVGLGFKDDWKTGKYDLLLVRGNEYQVIDEFDFTILYKESIEVNTEKVNGGLISVKGDGWMDIATYGQVDSLLFVNKETKQVVFSTPSTYKEDNQGKSIDYSFNPETFTTGDYELWVKRWNYNFKQKISDFAFFQYEFVNSTPIQKSEDGYYYLEFTLDEFGQDDMYMILDKETDGFIYYEESYLDKNNWNPETKVYRLKIQDQTDMAWAGDMKDGMKFRVDLNLYSRGILNRSVVGDNYLQLK